MPLSSTLAWIFFACTLLMTSLILHAYLRRKRARHSIGELLSLEEIHSRHFPELERLRFDNCWPRFTKLVGPVDAYNYLDYNVTEMESFFPLSDFLYDNLETFLSSEDGVVTELSVRELFNLYYDRFDQSPKGH